ncbi:hypothetical protein AVEN_193644-1 [Araneus ventricosus]|uniref:Uncharacterized protein n=1 Tax=Araneus ventricosus TaxID=182803 RepID=A0A4Y2HEY3_ARAVE|nr:hypothetical protein AVEN_193644-1 [Araneus ventricosus]
MRWKTDAGKGGIGTLTLSSPLSAEPTAVKRRNVCCVSETPLSGPNAETLPLSQGVTVARSRLLARRAPASKLDSVEEPLCLGTVIVEFEAQSVDAQMPFFSCGVEIKRGSAVQLPSSSSEHCSKLRCPLNLKLNQSKLKCRHIGNVFSCNLLA